MAVKRIVQALVVVVLLSPAMAFADGPLGFGHGRHGGAPLPPLGAGLPGLALAGGGIALMLRRRGGTGRDA